MEYRIATPADLPVILGFVRDLARYENAENEVVADETLLHHWMFERHVTEALIAFDDEKPVGFVIYFYNFSTWLGRAGIYIEDAYVRPEYRGRGIGRELFRRVAQKALREGCGRMEWWCLKWNTPSLEFYGKLGAEEMSEWMPLRLSGEALKKLADGKNE